MIKSWFIEELKGGFLNIQWGVKKLKKKKIK